MTYVQDWGGMTKPPQGATGLASWHRNYTRISDVFQARVYPPTNKQLENSYADMFHDEKLPEGTKNVPISLNKERVLHESNWFTPVDHPHVLDDSALRSSLGRLQSAGLPTGAFAN